MAKNEFNSVVPLLIGDHKYRRCVGYATQEGLVYATDSTFYTNTIRLLRNTQNVWDSIKIIDINDPSIYG